MKNNIINILSILIIAILAASIIMPLYYGTKSFILGFQQGYESSIESQEAEYAMFDVAFNPDMESMYAPSDTIRMAGNKEYPLVMTRACINVTSDNVPSWKTWIDLICNLAIIGIFIALIADFLKFVVTINKGRYFEKSNFRRLRRFGSYLLIISVLEIATGISNDIIFSNLGMSLKGYSLSTYWTIPWSNVVIGLLALMIAQVWKQAINIKEEHELTI